MKDTAGNGPTPTAQGRPGGRLSREQVRRLLVRHLPALHARARRRVGEFVRERESCSDLVQSFCREILEDSDRIVDRGEAAFERYLFAGLERKIIDRARYWRALKRDAGRELADAVDGDFPALGDPTPSRVAMGNEEADHLSRAIERLPENYRRVVVLSRIAGRSHAEIARELGKSEIAVRSLLCRALAELSAHL